MCPFDVPAVTQDQRARFIDVRMRQCETIEEAEVAGIDWWCGKISHAGKGLRAKGVGGTELASGKERSSANERTGSQLSPARGEPDRSACVEPAAETPLVTRYPSAIMSDE